MSDDPGKLCVYYSRRSRRRRDDVTPLVSVLDHRWPVLPVGRSKNGILHSAFPHWLRLGDFDSFSSQAGDGAIRGFRARHPQQDSRAGSLTAAMFWPSSSSAAKGTFRSRAFPRSLSDPPPSPRGSPDPSRGIHPRLFVPRRDFSRSRPTARDARPARVSTRPPGHTPAPSLDARASLPVPGTPVASISASPRRGGPFVGPRSRRCRCLRETQAEKHYTVARARLYVSTSTRRSRSGNLQKPRLRPPGEDADGEWLAVNTDSTTPSPSLYGTLRGPLCVVTRRARRCAPERTRTARSAARAAIKKPIRCSPRRGRGDLFEWVEKQVDDLRGCSRKAPPCVGAIFPPGSSSRAVKKIDATRLAATVRGAHARRPGSARPTPALGAEAHRQHALGRGLF